MVSEVNQDISTDRVPAEASVASLVGDIISDFQSLVWQQMRLTRQEIATNLKLRRAAAFVTAVGTATGFLATMMLCLSLVHLLHWMVSPAGSDPAWIPLGACYAIVSAVLFSASGSIIWLGRIQFGKIPPWQNLADEIFEENGSWKNNRK